MTTPTPIPNYGTASTGPTKTQIAGGTSIWDLPTDVNPGEQFWFDTGYSDASASGVARQQLNARRDQGSGVTVDQLNKPHSFEINATAEDVMKQFNAMSFNDPNAFLSLQKALAQGPWGVTVNPTGTFDPATEKALGLAIQQYLKTSEQSGVSVSFTDYLTGAAQRNVALGGGQGTAGSSAPILSDPDTLTRYAQMAAKNALGRALTPTELSEFVSQFHSQQVQSYTDAANHNGLSAMKDDPRSSAIGFVTTNNQQEFQNHQTGGYTDAFLNMFLPSGSNAPTVSVDPTAIGY